MLTDVRVKWLYPEFNVLAIGPPCFPQKKLGGNSHDQKECLRVWIKCYNVSV